MSGIGDDSTDKILSVGDRSLFPSSTWGSLDWELQQRLRESRVEQEQRFGPRPQHIYDGLPGGLYGGKPRDAREERARIVDDLLASRGVEKSSRR